MKQKFISNIIIYISLFVFCFSLSASEKQISYQGRLLDQSGSPVIDNVYTVEFILYTDSIAGTIAWAETADIQTTDGLFSYEIGSVNSLNSSLFQQYPKLYLELKVGGESILPRTKLNSIAYAFSSSELLGKDSTNIKAFETNSEKHQLTIFDSTGNSSITLQGVDGDSSVILPESAINADELLNEPGLTSSIELSLITLTNTEMMDLTKVTIEIPDDGYIVLIGKCYILLSGTTGANAALVQIDENEGGTTQFPYYTIAGLSGYVNSGTNYFPAFVTRIYYKQKGTYTFRLEGKANNPLPAVAQTWDHILTAYYYSTSYQGVEAIIHSQAGNLLPLPVSPDEHRDSQNYYKIDLKELEIKDKLK